MANYVTPFTHIDPISGEPSGEAQVTNRHLNSNQMTETYTGGSIEDPGVAPQVADTFIPAFSETATDEDIVAFWTDTTPLSQAQVDKIQDLYMQTNNQDIANLLMFRLTQDASHLSEQQKFELYLDGSEPVVEDTFSKEDAEERINFISNEPVEVSEASQQAVLSSDLSEFGDAGVVVQKMALDVTSGKMSVQQGMQQATNSGLDIRQLYAAYASLHNQTN